MEMEDFLPRIGTIVDLNAKIRQIQHIRCHIIHFFEKLRDDFPAIIGDEIRKRHCFNFWNNQCVNFCTGVDIVKCKDCVVFMNCACARWTYFGI